MKHLLLTTIAAVVLVGCGGKETDINKQDSDLLFQIVEDGDVSAVKKHLASGMHVDASGTGGLTLMHYLALHGHVEASKLLIEQGADVNIISAKSGIGLPAGVTPLDCANLKKSNLGVFRPLAEDKDTGRNHEMITLISSNGGRSGAEDSIFVAAAIGNSEVIQKQLDSGINVDEIDSNNSWRPLNYAVRWNQSGIAGLLIDRGAAVNAKDDTGNSPLLLAVRGNNLALAELLIAKGANVNARNKKNEGSLHIAVFGFWKTDTDERVVNKELVELLVTKGADVNEKNRQSREGETPLHMVAEWGRAEIADLLIRSGANVDALTGGQQTPLHKASFEGNNTVIVLLIEKGAAVNPIIKSAGSFNGMTPVDFAIRQNNLKTVDLLRKHGAKTGEELK